ncbi:biotin--[acetyl-CoA-carboxylase] ligase [Paracoccus sp. S-4012]|uniref:biotin--[acetyl-CoA-carboxylase] ligase n=1 Tax=Paracoccus sp. S-4012 TaxID=2665648 RepID=UPI001E367446|nr:biotin--[acetyl-CoA-carboxylase] ligase [Paracoccus sp. S-4012]
MTDAAAWPEGVARHVLAEIDSTNAEALRRAPELTGPAWFLALRQTAGRGRRGRAWSDPPGNFAATLLTFPAGPPADAARLSFVAALALQDALAQVCGPSARLALKWPNDVLLNGGKVAGILLESAGSGRRPAALAIGIGVNLAHAPEPQTLEPGAVPPVSVAGETGHHVDPETLLDLLAPAFTARERELAREGFAATRAAWLARAARLGETITARTGAVTRQGRFDGIDATGALILTTAAGREAIPAADVHFG